MNLEVSYMTKSKEEQIIEAIEETNKWWKGKFDLKFKPREIYKKMKEYLEARQIVILTGLRRVGKTTLMLKIAQDAQEKINKENIFYFSFDDFKKGRIKEIINIYARLMKKDLDKETFLFLFDEIQKVEDWEEQIKRVYDNYRNIKIIMSGSESLFIKKQSRESLAGRFFEFHIQPLKFKEYLVFKNKQIENIELYKEEIKL